MGSQQSRGTVHSLSVDSMRVLRSNKAVFYSNEKRKRKPEIMAKAALTELINGLHRLYLKLWPQGFYTFNPSILNNTTSFIFGLSFPNQKWVLIFGLPEPNQKWRLLISFGLRSSFVSRYYKKQPQVWDGKEPQWWGFGWNWGCGGFVLCSMNFQP